MTGLKRTTAGSSKQSREIGLAPSASLIPIVVILLIGLTAQRASATPFMRFTQGNTVVTVGDGSSLDSDPTSGIVAYAGIVGDFTIQQAGGWFNLDDPVPEYPSFILDSRAWTYQTSTVPGELTVEWTFTDLELSAPIDILDYQSGSHEPYADFSLAMYLNPSNAAFGTEEFLAQTGEGVGGSVATGFFTRLPALVEPFSVTYVATFGHVRIDDQLGSQGSSLIIQPPHAYPVPTESVPEPTSLLLVAMALFGLALLRQMKGAFSR